MMSTHVPSPARQTMHSAMYKMPSPNIRSDETWKDRYRQHCKQHFKRARDKLINKMRHLSFDDQNPPTLSAQEIVETEWVKMFGSLPPSSMDTEMDSNRLMVSTEEAEFEANWAIMNEIRRELELEQLSNIFIPDEQPEYIPDLDEFDQTQCPQCSNLSLYQLSANNPIACRLCPFQYYLKTGSLSDVHTYHRKSMSDCQESRLHTTLWYHDEKVQPSLLFVCTTCDLNYCLQ